MKAIQFKKFGEAEQVLELVELEKPQPKGGEVLIHMHMSGVNPSDVKKRAGSFPNLLNEGEVIPHSDGAGIIEAVGKGVDSARIGERVWAYQAQYGRQYGTCADYLVIDAKRAVTLPDNASFEVGACLGIPVMTAHRCVFADGDIKGQKVLVTGGAGRVGYYAIQWAKQAGAFVIATASNDADKEACLEVGADAVVNHRSDTMVEDILTITDGKKIGRVVDVEFGANLKSVLKIIDTNGVIATYSSSQVAEPKLPFLDMMYMDLTLRFVIVYAMPEIAKEHAVKDITKALEENSLKHRIAKILPIKKTADAHKIVEEGSCRGCVLVQI